MYVLMVSYPAVEPVEKLTNSYVNVKYYYTSLGLVWFRMKITGFVYMIMNINNKPYKLLNLKTEHIAVASE